MDQAFTRVKEHIDQFNYKIDEFERIQLFPEIISRLEFIKSYMESFQAACKDAHTAVLIDASVRQVVNPAVIRLTIPEPGVGKLYLDQCLKMIQESFIVPIEGLLSKEKKAKALESIFQLALYFNEVNHLFRSICGCENTLFKYSVKNFVNIKNTKTGIVLVSPPEHLEIIMAPFEAGLKEIVNVSNTSLLSIEKWSEQVRDRREKFLSLSVNVSQVQVAEAQERAALEQLNASREQAAASRSQTDASRYALYVQVVVVFLTLLLLGGSYKLNLYLDKMELESIVGFKNDKINTSNAEIEFLRKNISTLSSEIDNLKSEIQKSHKGQRR